MILTILFAAAALIGIVYLVILWNKGMLTRTTVIVIVSIAVVTFALSLFGRFIGRN